MITSNFISVLIVGCFGVWMLGYSLGFSVAWVRNLRNIV